VSWDARGLILEDEVAGEVGGVGGEDGRGGEREDEEGFWEVRIEVEVFTAAGEESKESE